MSQPDYEYTGLIAQTWDLLRGDTSRWPDRTLYRAMIARYGQPALDVGCATGRLVLDYLAQGMDIDGVDNSPEMLALCRDKAARLGLHPTLYEQCMESLDLPRRYHTILVPSSSFQLLTDLPSAREAMRRFFRHLSSGGALVMPFMIIWREGEPLDAGWKLVREQTRPQDGAIVRRYSRSRFDPAQRLEHTEDRYEAARGGEMIAREEHRRSPATRWYSQLEALAMYQETGFTSVHALHEFTEEPARVDDGLFTVVGVKS